MKLSSRPDETQVLGQSRVLGELAVLAVDGHEKARPHQVQHQFHLLALPCPETCSGGFMEP